MKPSIVSYTSPYHPNRRWVFREGKYGFKVFDTWKEALEYAERWYKEAPRVQ